MSFTVDQLRTAAGRIRTWVNKLPAGPRKSALLASLGIIDGWVLQLEHGEIPEPEPEPPPDPPAAPQMIGLAAPTAFALAVSAIGRAAVGVAVATSPATAHSRIASTGVSAAAATASAQGFFSGIVAPTAGSSPNVASTVGASMSGPIVTARPVINSDPVVGSLVTGTDAVVSNSPDSVVRAWRQVNPDTTTTFKNGGSSYTPGAEVEGFPLIYRNTITKNGIEIISDSDPSDPVVASGTVVYGMIAGTTDPDLSGYTETKNLKTDFQAKGDGSTNDYNALNTAWDYLASRPNTALFIPAGIYPYGSSFGSGAWDNCIAYGEGPHRSVLRPTSSTSSSITIAAGSDGIVLQDFALSAPAPMPSTQATGAAGFRFPKPTTGGTAGSSRNILMKNLLVEKVGQMAWQCGRCLNVEVVNCTVRFTGRDHTHYSGGCENVYVHHCHSHDGGDDGFACVAEAANPNKNIRINNNLFEDGNTSGVTFEGVQGGEIIGNKIYRSGTAGIRTASESGWGTGSAAVNNVLIQGNYLEGCSTRGDVGHPTILAYSNYQSIGPDVVFDGNEIASPATGACVRVSNSSGGLATVNVEVKNTTFTNIGSHEKFKIIGSATIRTQT